MAEEATDEDVGTAPEETQDTPTPEVDSGTQPEADGTPAEQPEDTDWEKRYKDLQSEYTRTSQEAAELRQAQAEFALQQQLADPETQDAALNLLVAQLGEDGAREWLAERDLLDEDEDDEDEETEFRDPRVDDLLAERQRAEEEQYLQGVEQKMESTLDGLFKEKKLDPSDPNLADLRELILDAASVRPSKDDPQVPDVDSAFKQFYAANEAALKAYRKSKQSAPVPPVPSGAGTPNPSLGNTNDRLARANAVALESLESA